MVGEDFKLTPKQALFCHEYVVDWNGTRAAKDAGYSELTAPSIACELLKNPKIKAYVEHIQKDIAFLAGVSALRNVKELAKIAYASISSLHDTWVELKEFNALTEDQRAAIESIDTKTEVRRIKVKEGEDIDVQTIYVKIRLHNKIAAIQEMNKMLGFNAPDKLEINEKLSTVDQKRERLQKLLEKAGGLDNVKRLTE